MFVKDNSGKHIALLINDKLSLKRKRFSLAHEMGHAFLEHHPVSFLSEVHKTRCKLQEVHANQFAAELLMPKKALVQNGFLRPEQISEICNVSLDAATIRAKQFGWMG